MRPSLEEQETIIILGRLDEKAIISTSDTRMFTKFDNLTRQNPTDWEFVRQETCNKEIVEKFYKCPINFVTFRSKARTGVAQSEQQKEAARERMIKRHQAKKQESAM